ncbi:hypothetical protein PLESTB_000006800 [Pleodorina starrii]|uniref:Uncharacterized protein n=1 Tax=Pleodorina starrii TaxID=330485 RepID=A0A9W6EWR8_9CHLO|nr:hypothetical protein PLESTM_000840400 [Pleodorina starrii]GLC47610.1 hypothetical protein PLESTB_000006800 [Pleodorina starrii]GLC75618.1 hypothetical protein PLESTF_001665800 [Pleodorina starrii]
MAGMLRGLGLQALRLNSQFAQQSQQPLRRSLADYAKPKVDTSLDHVFGDSSNKLAYNFEPMPAGSLFVRTLILSGVFFFPVWFMINDEYKYSSFMDKLAEAKAKKEASA